jgi:hypothetical protein
MSRQRVWLVYVVIAVISGRGLNLAQYDWLCRLLATATVGVEVGYPKGYCEKLSVLLSAHQTEGAKSSGW